jgi:signal peptidase I
MQFCREACSAESGALRSFFYYLRLLLLALVLALVIKVCLVEAYKIPSESMENTLQPGDFLLANKVVYGVRIPFTEARLPAVRDPQAGDVIVFRFPDDRRKNFIKRIVAVGGDTVEIIDKQVLVNHEKRSEEKYALHLDRTIIPRGTAQPRDNFGPLAVPPGEFFVMGDNRDNSFDSRFWGCVPRNLIIGKASVIHWSWAADLDAPEVKPMNPLSLLSFVSYRIRHLPSQVRWNRLFRIIS